MKKNKTIYKIFFMLFLIVACSDNLRDISFADNIALPTNVAAIYNITQDNTGLVTITPNADGAQSFSIYFGDSTAEPAIINQGESANHVYAEGTYEVKVVASNLNGETTEVIQQLIVSFKAPKNLVVVLENDSAISKKVNITANADFATFFEFDSGETAVTQPVVTGNIGTTISYQYQDAGTYSLKVIAKGGAIETTEYVMDFEVTEILAPINSAPVQPGRKDADVISIFSNAYTDVAGSDFYPNWGQATQYTPFDLNGDAIIQYSNLNYQGINIGSTQDLSSMEFLRLDIWTADAINIDTYLISAGSG
jgi:PKD repeat protein